MAIARPPDAIARPPDAIARPPDAIARPPDAIAAWKLAQFAIGLARHPSFRSKVPHHQVDIHNICRFKSETGSMTAVGESQIAGLTPGLFLLDAWFVPSLK
jgi:hypothetical protein